MQDYLQHENKDKPQKRLSMLREKEDEVKLQEHLWKEDTTEPYRRMINEANWKQNDMKVYLENQHDFNYTHEGMQNRSVLTCMHTLEEKENTP